MIRSLLAGSLSFFRNRQPLTYAKAETGPPADWAMWEIIDTRTDAIVRDDLGRLCAVVEIDTKKGWMLVVDRDAPAYQRLAFKRVAFKPGRYVLRRRVESE